MRLVCPSCEAKYEVPEDAIPDTGRDVQCANCNHSWFQMRSRPATVAPPASDAGSSAPTPVSETAAPAPAEKPAAADPVSGTDPELAAESGADAPQVTDPVPSDATSAVATAPKADLAADTTPEPEAEPEPTPQADAAASVEAAPAKPAAAAYAVDESVLAILREEAEREALARRAEVSPLETQPTLGIDTTMPARQQPVAAPVEAEAKPAARRDLLPDVEEINSTLRPAEVPSEEDAAAMQAGAAAMESRSGFRSGFLLVMAVAILGAAVYIGAPRLSSAVPGLSQPLTAYVGTVDGLRLRLDGLMRSATVAINGE